MAETEKQPVLGLSWMQLIAGSLAAMTSAWIASAFGVSGTIVGAAVGSLSASIATALYLQSLTRGKDLVRRPVRKTAGGSVIAADEFVESTVALSDEDPIEPLDEIVDDPQSDAKRNRQIIVGTIVALMVALGAIGVFELVSGNPFGQAERPAIGRPWQPAPTNNTPSPAPTTEPTATPTPTPTVDETTPGTEPTAEPTPEPTDPAPPELIEEQNAEATS